MDAAIAARDAAISDVREKIADVEAHLEQGATLISAQQAELAERQARIDDLERVADRLAERIAGRERELREVRDDLARLRAESDDRLASLATLAEQLDEVRGQARGQATRIRMRALRDAVELTERVAELTRRPVAMRERLLDSLERAIERIGADGDPPPPAPDAADLGAHHADRDPSELLELFEGLVEVEIGPLSDFSQLVGFEDAAGGIGAMSEISVRRFTQGRATLDLHLTEPVALLRELEERAPFEFRVRDTRFDRLILDVGEE